MPVIVFFAVLYAVITLHNYLYKRFWSDDVFFELTISQKAVFEGDSIIITENAANKKRLPLPWISVQFNVPHEILYYDGSGQRLSIGEEKYALFSLPSNKTQSKRHMAVCTKRGYYRIEKFVLSSSGFLLTSFYYQKLDRSYPITVYPRVVDIDTYRIPFKKIFGHILAKRFINPDPFEFKSIREYQPYDSFRQINFKAAAKTGVLMSNTYDYTVAQDILIFLNTQNYCEFYRNNVHENAIRLAASLAKYFMDTGIPTGLITTGEDILTAKPSRLAEGLSREHLTVIYEILARIDLSKPIEPDDNPSDSIPMDFCRDRVYLLISSNHNASIYEKYKYLKENGANVLWIVPMAEHDTERFLRLKLSDDIVLWEVRDGEE